MDHFVEFHGLRHNAKMELEPPNAAPSSSSNKQIIYDIDTADVSCMDTRVSQ